MERPKRITLQSGLRLILVPRPSSLTTAILVMVATGSKHETKEVNGISHFLEHMCFKGTVNRPRPIDIASELDGLGAQYNAFTSQEFTGYFAKVRNETFDRALAVVADLYVNPLLDPDEIEREKGVIIEEINMYEDTPTRRVHELFFELVYGDQPAGWGIAGRKEVVRRLKRDDFITYRRAHYRAPATVVVVAGGFDSRTVRRNVARHFASLRGGKESKKVPVQESQAAPQESVRFKETDQAHLILGFRAFSMFDPRRFALQLLAHVLGGGMSSRLFQRIREEMGAAYYVHASADLLSDHGLLSMAAGVQEKRIEHVIKAALEEFKRISEETIPAGELARAKEHLVGNLFLSLETSDEIALFYGCEEVLRVPLMTPEEVAKNIYAVTSDAVRAAARATIVNAGLNLAVIGSFQGRSFRDVLKVI